MTSTTTEDPGRFVVPISWSSERLYPWGEVQEDEDILAIQPDESWEKYDRCYSIPIHGKIGVVFFDDRYYHAYVSVTTMRLYLITTLRKENIVIGT